MTKLKNKVALVTGASGGLGKATAKTFAREGANVAICARSLDKLQQVAEECKEHGVEALAVKCDVMNRDDLNALVDETVKKFGKIDILVNNAISTTQGVSIMDHTDEILSNTVKSGFEAVWHMMRLCYPILKKNGGGRIINISSGAALMGSKLFGVYAGVKAGVHGITMVAAREWGPDKITVNSLAPVFYSDLSNKLFDEFGESVMKDIVPLGYIGDPDKDIAPVLAFLASDDARYITGQILNVDGGSDIHF